MGGLLNFMSMITWSGRQLASTKRVEICLPVTAGLHYEHTGLLSAGKPAFRKHLGFVQSWRVCETTTSKLHCEVTGANLCADDQ